MATYTLTFNGSETSNTDGTSSFFNNTKSQIEKLSYHKEIYAPCRIDARLKITDASSYSTMEQVRTSLVGSSVKLASEYEIASNYYVHDVIIEMKKENGNSIYYLNLTIYSKDKLLDIVEECHSYVGQHLCKDILAKGVSRYTDGTDFTIETNADAKNLQFIGYKGKDASGNDAYKELIQPYTVQYNETFYSMLARTANRCGEFMYFEDGKLNVGFTNGTCPTVSNLAISNVSRPTLSANNIFNSAKLFSRNYMLNQGTFNFSSSSANTIINTIDYLINNNSNYEGLSSDDLIKAINTIKTEMEAYQHARMNVELYEHYSTLIDNVNNTLDGEPYSSTSVADYLKEDDYDNSTKCDAAKTKVDGDYTTKKTDLESYIKNNRWDQAKADEYEELRKMSKKERKAQGKQERYEELEYLKYNQDEIEENINNANNEIQRLKNISDKIALYKQRAEYLESQKRTQGERTWNGTDYTETSAIDDAWDKYIKDNKELNDALTKLKEAIGKLDESEREPLLSYLDYLLEMLQSTKGIDKSNDNDFIYDYAVPTDEYHLEYENGKYDDRYNGGYTSEVEGRALGYKFLNLACPFVEATLKVLVDMGVKMGVMCSNRDSANAVMDAAMGISDMKPSGADDDEYKKDSKHLLYSSYDNESATILKNINNASFATIRHCEEKLKGSRLIINVNTTDNKAKAGLGYVINYNNEDYIITKITGSYDSVLPAETIEAVPAISVDGILYKIPPMIAAGHIRHADPQTAKVVYNKDPNNLGRVRVRYGWQKEDTIDGGKTPSPFIRVATPFAGVGGGIFFQLAQGEEVMIDYDHGNVERPYVSCSLYNAVVTPAKGGTRIIRSQNGHRIVFTDESDNAWVSTIFKNPAIVSACIGDNTADFRGEGVAGGISITDDLGFYKIEASSHQRKISLSSPLGKISVSAFSGIEINAPYGDINLYGKNVAIKARNKIEMESGIGLGENFFASPNMKQMEDMVTSMVGDIIDLTIVRVCIERILEPVEGFIRQKAATSIKQPIENKLNIGLNWCDWARSTFLGWFFSDTKEADEAGVWNDRKKEKIAEVWRKVCKYKREPRNNQAVQGNIANNGILNQNNEN